MKQIYLNENNSKLESNTDSNIGIYLTSDQKMVSETDISEAVSAYDEYVAEKDASNIYRLIFTINPLCTNILFNHNTEVVYKEGSDDCKIIKDNESFTDDESINGYNNHKKREKMNPIEDTAYSHPEIGGLTYHCGVDIFDNHTLRRKNFAVVNKDKEGSEHFNTLRDFLRDDSGNIIKEQILKTNADGSLYSGITNMHLYTYDSVKSFQQSVNDNLIESDGWVGFINPVSLNIPNYKDISINKCMNDKKAGEMVDMYPDRTLYSFIPKINKYRKRIEKNWDYCLTYPSSNDEEHEIINGGLRCKILSDLSETIFAGGTVEYKKIYLETEIRNSFQENDMVVFEVGSQTSPTPVRISGIGMNGEDTAHIFSVDVGDLYLAFPKNDSGIPIVDESTEIRARKFVRGAECKYYIRKFRKIRDDDFSNNLNKLAFSENIYSDKIAQIVYNEDINLEGLTDNLGRAVSEIYLTIVKRNAGNNIWDTDSKNNAVEYSHCFSDVSDGLDMLPQNKNYNIHYYYSGGEVEPLGSSAITINDEEFLGDIVEFSPNEVKETVLENVYHRFNTMQRENDSDIKIKYHEIKSDDYDIDADFEIETLEREFNRASYEGYYYQPHYRVSIREFSEKVNQGSHRRVKYTDFEKNGIKYTVTTAVNYYFNEGDKIYLYDQINDIEIRGINVESVANNSFTFEYNGDEIKNPIIYKINSEKPSYAYELADGSGRYLWRDVISEKDLLPDNETYDSMFMNGAHYRHKLINFYLRRQDPFGEYGLNTDETVDWFTGAAEGKIRDVSYVETVPEKDENIC